MTERPSILVGLRPRRRAAGLTQSELGELLGVTRHTVSFWERGECMPSREHLIALAEVFGVDVDALFAEAPTFLPTKLPAIS